MATKLKHLKVTSVDFVDEGANPDAHIRLYKRRDEVAAEPGTEDHNSDGAGFFKRLSSSSVSYTHLTLPTTPYV